eukprot:8283517-Ditylum_brightwellii.AAC.1
MIERRWGLYMNPPPETTPEDWDQYEEYEDNDEIARSLLEVEETVDANGTLIDQQSTYGRICQYRSTTASPRLSYNR